MCEAMKGLIEEGEEMLEKDAEDAVKDAMARSVNDAIVDFLADLPDDEGGIVESTLRFQRAMMRTIDRGMELSELRQASTWAVVLDELLDELAAAGNTPPAVQSAGVQPPDDVGLSLLLKAVVDRVEKINDGNGAAGAEALAEALSSFTRSNVEALRAITDAQASALQSVAAASHVAAAAQADALQSVAAASHAAVVASTDALRDIARENASALVVSRPATAQMEDNNPLYFTTSSSDEVKTNLPSTLLFDNACVFSNSI